MYLLLVTCSLATQCLVVLVAGSCGLLAERVKIRPHITTSLGKDDIRNSKYSSYCVSGCWTTTKFKKSDSLYLVTCPLFATPREAVNVAGHGSGYCGDSRCLSPESGYQCLPLAGQTRGPCFSAACWNLLCISPISGTDNFFCFGASLLCQLSSYKFRQKCRTEAVQR